MNKIIATLALTLTLSVLSSAQTAATTRTVCKGDAIPEGYTTVGEAQSSDCPNGAWVIKQRGAPKLKLEQSADRPPQTPEENASAVAGSRKPASSNGALEFAQSAPTAPPSRSARTGRYRVSTWTKFRRKVR